MKLAALALALLALAAAPASAGAVSERHFQTPSHRIACMMFHAYVRCDTFFENDTAYYVPRTGKGRAIHVTDYKGVYVAGVMSEFPFVPADMKEARVQ